jgi:hypothetical protein
MKFLLSSLIFSIDFTYVNFKGKGKAFPLQAYGAYGSGRLRLPDSVTLSLEGGWFSALRTVRLYPKNILVLFLRG